LPQDLRPPGDRGLQHAAHDDRAQRARQPSGEAGDQPERQDGMEGADDEDEVGQDAHAQ
jgi:hypothetical protein